MYGFIDCLCMMLICIIPFMALIVVGGIIADYVLPRIKPLEKWIESLPICKEDKDEP